MWNQLTGNSKEYIKLNGAYTLAEKPAPVSQGNLFEGTLYIAHHDGYIPPIYGYTYYGIGYDLDFGNLSPRKTKDGLDVVNLYIAAGPTAIGPAYRTVMFVLSAVTRIVRPPTISVGGINGTFLADHSDAQYTAWTYLMDSNIPTSGTLPVSI